MPVYQLSHEIVFPHPSLADPDGLLAVGGDLSVDRLLTAYANGIFPWYTKDEPVLWWSPDPRCLFLPPKMMKISKSLKQSLRNKLWRISTDTAFEQVIRNCAEVKRAYEDGTWILPEMQQAYISLHEEGYAHSVEIWHGSELVGGLYGLSLGAAFMGESMFHRESDASKAALYYLCELAVEWNFLFIDNQMPTDHLTSLGAQTVSRKKYLKLLSEAIQQPTKRGCWTI
jgi:leucyl/phenylalanyl-tRNA---protein transferase